MLRIMRDHVLLSYLRYLFVLVCRYILCCVFDLFFFVLCTLCCQFLWIIHFWMPLRHSISSIQYDYARFICTLKNISLMESYPTWLMTQPNKSGLWLAHAATSNPPLEPPLMVILKYQKLQHDQTLCCVIVVQYHFQ